MGYVYFVQVKSSGDIKIGFSTNVIKRMSTLQTAIPEKIKLLGYITGDLDTEMELHKKFRALSILGEWFKCDPKIIDYLNEHNEMRLQTGMGVFIDLDESMNTQIYGTIKK